MRGALEVVPDGLADFLGIEGIAEAFEDGAELFGGEQVEKHKDICLFGSLVGIRSVAFALQDPVQPRDVAISVAVAGPVELCEGLVPLELTQDAVIREDETYVATDLVPMRDLLVVQ